MLRFRVERTSVQETNISNQITLGAVCCVTSVSAPVELTLYSAAETDLVPTLLEFLDTHATTMAWQ